MQHLSTNRTCTGAIVECGVLLNADQQGLAGMLRLCNVASPACILHGLLEVCLGDGRHLIGKATAAAETDQS
jgi:hypothetical protein